MLPLHHGEGAGGGNWLQRFNDSEAGVLLGSILHSVGALLFAAAIALYLYVAHSLRRAGREGGPTNVGLLNYAHVFNIIGIATNGIGGIARLYESDHPSIERLGDSTWVQVLFLKHLFLIAGVGFAVYLTWRTYRLTRPSPDMERLHRESPRMTVLAAASLATILLSGVLGAVATNVDLAADLGLPPAGATDPNMEEHPADHGPRVLADSVHEGVITDASGTGTPRTSETTIPEGANRIVVVLSWGSGTTAAVDPSELSLALRNPEGQAPTGETSVVGKSITIKLEGLDVRPGLWTFSVSGRQAFQTSYELRVTAVRTDDGADFIERTVSVPTGRFFEANLLMAGGTSLSFQWEVVGSDRAVYFDVHLHVDGTVTYPVQGEWNRYAGNYTHDGSTQGPSLLWENGTGGPISIHFRLRGDFSVHSYV